MSKSQPLAIIPSYRRPDQLERCLAALAAGSVAPAVFVHDNSTENSGFTRACNAGLRQALREGRTYALLINQDCYVEPGAVVELIRFMEAQPRCAIAGAKQVRADNPDEIVHGGCRDAYPEGVHITGAVSRGDCAASAQMPWVNGACWIVRMTAVAEIGLMDESFFLIGSDADYCFTARQRGWEVWFCADAVVRHETGGVSAGGAVGFDQIAHYEADQRRFRDKWLGTVDWELLRLPVEAPAHDAHARLLVAQGHYGRGEDTEAEIASRQALAIDPDLTDARLVLGLALLRRGWAALAAVELRRVIDCSSPSPELHFTLADALNSVGEAREAVDHYTHAIGLGLALGSLYNNRGLALIQLGEVEAAMADWRQALILDPMNANARENLTSQGAKPGVSASSH